jgi:hypothetical protein
MVREKITGGSTLNNKCRLEEFELIVVIWASNVTATSLICINRMDFPVWSSIKKLVCVYSSINKPSMYLFATPDLPPLHYA